MVALLIQIISWEYYKFKRMIKTKHLVNEQSGTLCGHEIKSLLDQYSIFIYSGYLMIIISFILYFNDRTLSYKNNYIATGICFFIYLFFMFYLSSEVKHLSPEDSVGKVANYDMKYHFIKIFIFGILNSILAVSIMVNLFSYIEVICILITALLVSILNLGNLFQNHNDYNSKNIYISFFSSTIHPVFNLIKIIVDRKYKNQVKNGIKNDLNNIYLGLIEIFRIIKKKHKKRAIQ